MKENMYLGISQSRVSTPSQEVKQISHLLILVGFFSIAGSFWGRLSRLGLGPISGPCNLCPELVWSRTRKRNKTLALLTEAELVETLMYLHLSPVVGHLLANQVL